MTAPLEQRPHQLRRNHHRRDVLNEFNDSELIRRYRFDKAGILYITSLVREALCSETGRSNPLSPEVKVIITLSYLATGRMQQYSSDDFGPSQSSISRTITQTIDALADPNVLKKFIYFPVTTDRANKNKEDFLAIANFPNIVGAIDGTHIRIVAPREQEEVYVNRKGFHSINVQIVFDASYRILDILAKWPGSVHDAHILNNSGLSRLFDGGYVPAGSHLLGDGGYLSKTWLLTPYLHPLPGPQSRYNRAHKRTHNVVEQGIEQLKRRFHILHSEVRVSPPLKVCKIIQVCGMLHNICKERNIPLLDEDQGMDLMAEILVPLQENDATEELASAAGGHQNEGHTYRDAFCDLYFNNED